MVSCMHRQSAFLNKPQKFRLLKNVNVKQLQDILLCFIDCLIDFGQTNLVSNKKKKQQFFRVNVTTNTSDTDSHTGS